MSRSWPASSTFPQQLPRVQHAQFGLILVSPSRPQDPFSGAVPRIVAPVGMIQPTSIPSDEHISVQTRRKWGELAVDGMRGKSTLTARRTRTGLSANLLESDADPILLDPDHSADPNRAILLDHEPEMRRDESRIWDFDGSSFRRHVQEPAAHAQSAYRNIGRFIDLDARMLAAIIH